MTALAKAKDRALTPKMRRFAEEYLVDLNATQAAIRAGYSVKTADVAGARLRRNPGVAALLAEHAVEAGRRLALTVERVEKELVRVAFFDPATLFGPDGKLLPIHEMPEDSRRALAGFEQQALFDTVVVGVGPRGGEQKERLQVGVTTKLKFANKIEALRAAMQRLGMLIEKHEFNLPANVSINIGTRRKRAPAGGSRP